MARTVGDPTDAYIALEQIRELPRVLMRGTRGIQDPSVRRKYLPPEEEEEIESRGNAPSEYEQRIARTVVHPYYRRAVKRAVNSILAKEIVLQADVPESLAQWWENVDLRGNNGTQFIARVLEDAIGEGGFSAVLVDHPPIAARGATNADITGSRPYWVHVRARDIIGVSVVYDGGRETLRQVRIRESRTVQAGWEEKTQKLIRVLTAAPGQFVTWQLYVLDEDGRDDEWRLLDEGDMRPHLEIPLRAYYANRVGPLAGEPPFEDLAWLNLQHTREDSDQGESLRISGGAQLAWSGLDAEGMAVVDKQKAIGAKRNLKAPEGATVEWLERSGAAARVMQERQDRLEARMLALANEPHVRRTGTETATGRAIDTAEAKTELQAWALALQDFLEELFVVTAATRGIPAAESGSVSVTLPKMQRQESLEGLRFLKELRAETGFPSLPRIFDEVKRQGFIDDGYDVLEDSADVPLAPSIRSAS